MDDLDKWHNQQMRNWRYRFWTYVLAPFFWFEKKRIQHRHRKHRIPSTVMRTQLPEPGDIQEALWRLVKRILAFAVCEVDTCDDCDMLRDITGELLRLKAWLRSPSP